MWKLKPEYLRTPCAHKASKRSLQPVLHPEDSRTSLFCCLDAILWMEDVFLPTRTHMPLTAAAAWGDRHNINSSSSLYDKYGFNRHSDKRLAMRCLKLLLLLLLWELRKRPKLRVDYTHMALWTHTRAIPLHASHTVLHIEHNKGLYNTHLVLLQGPLWTHTS